MDAEIAILKHHEGFKQHMYKCTAGKTTIGYGLNLEEGIEEPLAELILQYQYIHIQAQAKKLFPWFMGLSLARRHVICNMIFNLGLPRFRKFQKMRAAIRAKAWDTAADEMLNSKWASQVGERALDLAHMMRTGDFA